MKLLTKEQQESYENAKICKEKVMRNMLKIKLEITVTIKTNIERLPKTYVI